MILAGALEWWIDGLTAGLLSTRKILYRPRRFRLDSTTSGPFVLLPINGATPGSASPIELTENAPQSALALTQGSVIEVVVPSAAILEKRLDPLPSESRPYVDNVVRHQIETLFPWRAVDILHTIRINHRGDGRLDVSVLATPRSAVAPALSAAAACGAEEIVIVANNVDSDLANIPVTGGLQLESKTNRARTLARYAIAGLLTLALCTIGWTGFARWTLESEAAALDQAIAERRAVLARASDPRNTDTGGGFEARKQRAVIATVVLEALSSVLPDDTYLTDISLDAGRLRITGVSSRAAELVPLLEGSGHFSNASFYAPTTRMPGRATDRFSIESAVVPRVQVTP